MSSNIEDQRLEVDAKREMNWKRWGPYLSERQWGTVREDYSVDGNCWDYFPHDQSRSRAYRWGEDGLLGITDRQCRLCFALALWNHKDPILKERLYGLTPGETNHGEDVKELYYYLDSTPTHSYMRALYKYPQAEFPYQALVSQSRARSRDQTEYELLDTGIFANNEYFDVQIEYAKAEPNDIGIKISITNKAQVEAPLTVLPTLWYRNFWSWGREGEAYGPKPEISRLGDKRIIAKHHELEPFVLESGDNQGFSESLFTENETNIKRLYGSEMSTSYVKDSFHSYVVNQEKDAVNPLFRGTKAAFMYSNVFAPGETKSFYLRLISVASETAQNASSVNLSINQQVENLVKIRREESDLFYKEKLPKNITEDESLVMRQSYAGLLWSKQFYYYAVKEWHEGDPTQPPVAETRHKIRNAEWKHLYNRDVLSMPDKWEYPWFAAWDLAFHMIPFCKIDPHFSKEQLLLFLREWYMHPNGQIPAYEFAFSDVNPPVHAWACWRVYKMTAARGGRDRVFLARAFHKLLLNFTWWVNRKDVEGKNLFSGGFLGLDNIGVFDRGAPTPFGGHLEQADGTAWMAFYCATMLAMALELAKEDPAYEDVASKFFEHFIAITDAINNFDCSGLWDQLDGFYYDQLHFKDHAVPLRVRSLVGVIPMMAVEILEQEIIETLPGFNQRLEWFVKHRQDMARHISYMQKSDRKGDGQRLLAVPSRERLERMLNYILDEKEFLSPYGIRSLSKIHQQYPYVFKHGTQELSVDYTPGESNTQFFGGNSNWRGPVWFPLNYLLIEALEKYHHFYRDTFKVECPTGSGHFMNLQEVAQELAKRLSKVFLSDESGRRPCHGDEPKYQSEESWKDLVLFYEYFHGDNGRGVGASHQTGWTALVTRCIEKTAYSRVVFE